MSIESKESTPVMVGHNFSIFLQEVKGHPALSCSLKVRDMSHIKFEIEAHASACLS